MRRRRMLGTSFGRILETAPAVIPLVTFPAAIRRDEEKSMKDEVHSSAPSGPVAGRALAVGTYVWFSGVLHDNLSYSGLGSIWYTQASQRLNVLPPRLERPFLPHF
jgi:hypothetical protein